MGKNAKKMPKTPPVGYRYNTFLIVGELIWKFKLQL